MGLRVLFIPVAAAVFALPSLHTEKETARETETRPAQTRVVIERLHHWPSQEVCSSAAAMLEKTIQELQLLEQRIMEMEEERQHLLDMVMEMQHERIPIEPSPEEFAPVPLAPVACIAVPATPVRIQSHTRPAQG